MISVFVRVKLLWEKEQILITKLRLVLIFKVDADK